jgi:F420-0:gamma-glutamyl ligase-like protein
MSEAVGSKEEQITRTVSVSTASVDGDNVSRTVTLTVTNLARSIGAIASLAGAVSVLVGVLAQHYAPHGWGRVTMALHLTKRPLLLQLAPYIAGFAVAAATAAGVLSFYSWYRESRDQKPS